MNQQERDRYVVSIEVKPANNPWELTEEDLDDDNLAKISTMLKSSLKDPHDDGSSRTLRLDLCSNCRDRFLENPLKLRTAPTTTFSEN